MRLRSGLWRRRLCRQRRHKWNWHSVTRRWTGKPLESDKGRPTTTKIFGVGLAAGIIKQNFCARLLTVSIDRKTNNYPMIHGKLW